MHEVVILHQSVYLFRHIATVFIKGCTGNDTLYNSNGRDSNPTRFRMFPYISITVICKHAKNYDLMLAYTYSPHCYTIISIVKGCTEATTVLYNSNGEDLHLT